MLTQSRANEATIQVTSSAIIKVRSRPLIRYGTHQKTISGRPGQMYTPSDTRLEWAGERLLFESHSNEHQRKRRQLVESSPGPLLKSCLGSLARYGTH